MTRPIRIKITPDGRVEIDSSVYNDCKEVASQLTKHLGKIESFVEKDEILDGDVRVKLDAKD